MKQTKLNILIVLCLQMMTGLTLLQIFPPGRGGTITGRSYQSQNVTGMESPQDFIRGTGGNHGETRYEIREETSSQSKLLNH